DLAVFVNRHTLPLQSVEDKTESQSNKACREGFSSRTSKRTKFATVMEVEPMCIVENETVSRQFVETMK
ncbi:hypothetical protein WH47_11566, partial [Habropoda laboriosa]